MGICADVPSAFSMRNMNGVRGKITIMKSAYETYQEADVPGRIRDVQNRLTETAKNVSTVTDDYVHDHPWQTVAMAAVIGCVIGFLIGHRD
jgi:ElaB/YqjD/DUF883 family membrane-anchored ribosome-binding protein